MVIGGKTSTSLGLVPLLLTLVVCWIGYYGHRGHAHSVVAHRQAAEARDNEWITQEEKNPSVQNMIKINEEAIFLSESPLDKKLSRPRRWAQRDAASLEDIFAGFGTYRDDDNDNDDDDGDAVADNLTDAPGSRQGPRRRRPNNRDRGGGGGTRDRGRNRGGRGRDRKRDRDHRDRGGRKPNRGGRARRRNNRRRGGGGGGEKNQNSRHRDRNLPTSPEGILPTLPFVFPGQEGTTSGPTTTQPEVTTMKVKSQHVRVEDPVHRDEDVPSGQLVRLRGGETHSQGRVEVYVRGRWGLVCDDDWEINDANQVCRQLGFTGGAISAIGGSAYGSGSYMRDDILLDEVECDGSELTVTDCHYATQHDCDLSEIASVLCAPNTGCGDGWVAGNGLCYKLLDQFVTFNTAHDKCSQMGAHLVTVENQVESDFLNNWLTAHTNESYYFTAGHKITGDGMEYWKWHGTLYGAAFTKWFPGWPPNGAGRQPSNHTGQNCLTLARHFYDDHSHLRDVGYYFWNDAPCTVRLPFICERVSNNQQDCFSGNGQDYRGSVYRTERGTLCEKWTRSEKINPTLYPDQKMGLGDHNLCRNPDGDKRPWCWVDVTKGSFGYCALGQCGDRPAGEGSGATNTSLNTTGTDNRTHSGNDTGGVVVSSTQQPQGSTTTLAEGTSFLGCEPGEFTCVQSDWLQCIPGRWRCDGERDCFFGEDELLCPSDIHQFRRVSGYLLVLDDRPSAFTVTYIKASVEKCAKLCLNARDFVCRSFNYENAESVCMLTDVNAGQMTEDLVIDREYTYYELSSQTENCTDSQFQCDNTKCVSRSKVCDGYDDCNDFSDEHNCGGSTVQLRLAGGLNEHEGRVEVRYLGEWGVVCDDGWTLSAAHVVCRQLGYLGAVRATVMSEFGPGNGNFLLDETRCSGEEERLSDCEHSRWRDHNCRPFETAGVVCKVGKVCRPTDQFECDNKLCVPLTYVCDGQDHCGDGSDERECDDIKVVLVGRTGPSDHVGRVEVIRNGVRGTVCDDQWDDYDAQVICSMMGFDGPAVAFGSARYGQGSGVIWLDDVDCHGSERHLGACQHAAWGRHNCDHGEDAAVICNQTRNRTFAATGITDYRTATSNRTVGGVPLPQCGYRPIVQDMRRVVGGYHTVYGAYPWQAATLRRGWLGGYATWCGGTIINEYWVLSSAHCYINQPKAMFRVRVGDWDNSATDEFEQELEVLEIITHENHSKTTHDYDVALIRVQGPITFSPHVQAACLPPPGGAGYDSGRRCSISGWGSTGNAIPGRQKVAGVPLLSPDQCSGLYKDAVTSRMFCAGYLEGNVDICQGDHGGPLVCHLNGVYTVLGITSWGFGCASPNAPGVYTKVSAVLPWIQYHMDRLS